MTIQEAKNKVVSLARSQVGYHEGANNQNKYADDPRITQLYGWNVQNQPWCCSFVNWCFLNAFGTVGGQMTYGGSAACATQASYYRNHGAFFQSPEVGDQIFFYSGGGINHTGIVVEVNGMAIRTVEGNYSDKVSLCTYQQGNSVIAGYGRPKWSLAADEAVDENFETADTSSDSYLNALAGLVGAKPTEQTTVNKDEDHELILKTLQRKTSYDQNVVLLQVLLTLRNFPCGSIDGYFGAKTESALKKFQIWAGIIPVDGTCGSTTWEKLGVS